MKDNEQELATRKFRQDVKQRSDVLVNYFLVLYFLAGIIFAAVYDTWFIATGVGGLAVTAYYSAKILLPKSDLYQYILSGVLGIFMAQFIYQLHGLFEMHFFAFIGSALLITYQNWKLQIPMLLFVVVHHLVFGYLQNIGYSTVYFTQLDSFDFWVFSVHIILATVIFFVCGLWSYQLKKYSEKHIWQSIEVSKLQKEASLSEQLKQSNQRFSTLIQKGADLIVILDANKCTKYLSSNVYKYLSYPDNSLVGTAFTDFIHPDDLGKVLTESNAILSEKEIKLSPYRFRHASGQYLWFETILTNMLDQPSIEGLLCNTRDITERKKTDIEREQMIKELTKSNADLKQFSYITSHNLRAPLSNMLGILSIIDYDSLSKDNMEMLTLLQSSTRHLNTTIDDLNSTLLIRKNIDVGLSDINLRELFNYADRLFAEALKEVGGTIETDFKIESVHTNKAYLQSIFINLISNAIKYCDPKRRLVLKITCKRLDAKLIQLKFCDNGSGLNMKRYKDRLFGMYQRFHTNNSGTGLGLFIIKEQVAALRGSLTVDSEVGKGTTFTITLKQKTSDNFYLEETSDVSMMDA